MKSVFQKFALVFLSLLMVVQTMGGVVALAEEAGEAPASADSAAEETLPGSESSESSSGESKADDASPAPESSSEAPGESSPSEAEEPAGNGESEAIPEADSLSTAEAEEEPAFAAGTEEDDAAPAEEEATPADEGSPEELGFMPGEVIVVFNEDVGEQTAEAVVEQHDGEVAEVIDTPLPEVAVVADIPATQTVAAAVEELTADPDVKYAQPNFFYTADEGAAEDMVAAPDGTLTNDPKAQWHLDAIKLSGAWDAITALDDNGLEREPVKVAILDLPFYFGHEDFAPGVVNDTYRNYSSFTSDIKDTATTKYTQLTAADNHATHVGGLIAAAANNSIGVTGVASGRNNNWVELVPMNVFVKATTISTGVVVTGAPTSCILPAIAEAVDVVGAKVVNMSLGADTTDMPQTDAKFQEIIAYAANKGCTVVCSAGNTTGGGNTNRYMPSDDPNAISVINLQQSGGTYTRAPSSNYGPDKDISAPGTGIMSTVTNNGYANMNGTSMSSPIVAGVAALMLRANPNLTPAEVKDLLCNNATGLADPDTAAGIVNATASVEAAVASFTKVTGVSLSTSSASLPEGDDIALVTDIQPANATFQTLKWTSSDTRIATVDDAGLVTAVSRGSATITAAATDGGGAKAAANITVTPLVTGVTLNYEAKDVFLGGTLALAATVEPSAARNKTVTWASSDETIATVDANGLVTAVALGTATITVTTVSGGETASCNITVQPVKVSGVSLSPAGFKLLEGKTQALSPTVLPANATVRALAWQSSNTAVATVDNTGLVTAVAEGTAIITATAADGSGKTGTASVTVQPQVTGVSVFPASCGFLVGQTALLTATVQPGTAPNDGVAWQSSNEAVATVTAAGVVTGVGPGTANITATTVENGKTGVCTVTITQKVRGVALNYKAKTVKAGKTLRLKATVSPANASNPAVTWKSSKSTIASVGKTTGIVTAKKSGTVTITCTTKDGGYPATCKITVGTPVSKVKLNNTEATVKRKKTITLAATISPASATNQKVTWKSSNKTIATVTSKGEVKGVKKGKVSITCTTSDGAKVAKCVVTVK